MSNSRFKFRAWDSNKNTMLSNIAISNNATYETEIKTVCAGHGDYYNTISLKTYYGMPHNNLIPMQFTGLLDKNGVEIYEGDIMKSEYPAGYSLYEIKFGIYDNGEEYDNSETGNGWYLEESRFFKESMEDSETSKIYQFNPNHCPLNSYEYEVIGNIYENENLLEGK